MKARFYLMVLLFSISLNAQKTVLKEIDYNQQNITIQLQDIDLLEIVHSDKNKISFSMNEYPENLTRIEIIVDKTEILISTSEITPFQEGLKLEKFCYEQPLFPSYKLTLPKGCNIEISFKNGNFSAQNFEGNLNLSLNTGDVSIHNFDGSIYAELFSGNIKAAIKNTEIFLLTNHGKITTTFPTTVWKKTDISLKGTLGNKMNLLKVKSINANVELTQLIH